MTGYTVKNIEPSELILGQSKISAALIIIALIGLALMTLSVLTKIKIINPPENFFNMFLGMGIIFFAGSIIFMIRKIPDTISFNKDSCLIIFSENKHQYSRPYADFNRLQITGKISSSENRTSAIYQLSLDSKSGSSLLLSESEDKSELTKAAETLLTYIDIDLLSGGELLHSGKTAYHASQPVYPPGNMICITKSSAGGTDIYRWNSRKSITVIFLLGAVIFGFNFLFFTWAYPGLSRYNAGLYAGSAIIMLMDILFSLTLLFYIFGSNIAEVSDSMFSYHQHFFGFNINRKSFNSGDVAAINCGFTSDDNKITLFTKRGIDIQNELKIFASLNRLNEKSALMQLIPVIMELRNNIIEIDGTPLYYYEKLYLENEWSKKLKLN